MRQQVPKSSAADSYKSPIDPQPSHSPPKSHSPQNPSHNPKKVRIRHISHAPTTQYVLNANLLEGSRVPSDPNPAATFAAASILAIAIPAVAVAAALIPVAAIAVAAIPAAAVVAAAIAEASITAAASIPAAAIPVAPPHTAAPSLQPAPLQPHPFSTQNFEYEEIVERSYSGFHVFSVGCAPSLCSISLLHMVFYLQVWFSESSRPEFC